MISAFLRDLFLNLRDEVRSLFSLFQLHRTPCLYVLTTLIVANLFFVILQLLIDYPPLPPNCKVHEGRTLSVFNSLVSPRQPLHSWGPACLNLCNRSVSLPACIWSRLLTTKPCVVPQPPLPLGFGTCVNSSRQDPHHMGIRRLKCPPSSSLCP